MENRWGTASAPIVFMRAPGATGTVLLAGAIDVRNCTYLYFSDLLFRQVGAVGCRRVCRARCLLHCCVGLLAPLLLLSTPPHPNPPRLQSRCPGGCGGDLVHFADSDYIHLIRVKLEGLPGDAGNHETLKVRCATGLQRRPTRPACWQLVDADAACAPAAAHITQVNQVQGMYVEDCDISGAGDNAIDFVAVQYGHICRTRIHKANWCVYAKGGSAYLLMDSNDVFDCGESGLSIGQGTGFEYMTPPWLNYEGYGIQVRGQCGAAVCMQWALRARSRDCCDRVGVLQVTNNVIRNVWGAGLGVAGGYNVLVAHNSMFRCEWWWCCSTVITFSARPHLHAARHATAQDRQSLAHHRVSVWLALVRRRR